MVECGIHGCGRPVKSKGMCRGHYRRAARHGDPCKGLPLRGDILSFANAVPSSGDGCLRWPFGTNGAGYGRLTIVGEEILAHRYLCEKHHGPPPNAKSVATHSCGKGHEGCIAPWHLSWNTRQGNAEDSRRHGVLAIGERAGAAKLTNEDVIQIRQMAGTMRHRDIGDRFGVSATNVGLIIRRKTWAHVDD